MAKTFALTKSQQQKKQQRQRHEVVVEDDVPEWIDKGFVINEKQVAYESKNVKKRKICVSFD